MSMKLMGKLLHKKNCFKNFSSRLKASSVEQILNALSIKQEIIHTLLTHNKSEVKLVTKIKLLMNIFSILNNTSYSLQLNS